MASDNVRDAQGIDTALTPAFGGRRLRRSAAQGARTKRRSQWVVGGLGAWLLLLLVRAGSTLYALNRHFANRTYPNITVRGVPVGGLTLAEAQTALRNRYDAFLTRPITLAYGERQWFPQLGEVGARLEIDAAVQAALAVGRTSEGGNDPREIAALWQRGVELPLRLRVDQGVLQHYLMARAAEVERPAQDARLVVQGVAISVAPPKEGTQVLLDDTMRDLTAALQTLEPQTVAIRTRALVPQFDMRPVTAARQRVQALLQAPLTLVAGETTFSWTVDEIAELLRVRQRGSTT